MKIIDIPQPLQPAEPSAEALSPKSSAIPVAKVEQGDPAVTSEKLDLVGKAKQFLTAPSPQQASRPRLFPNIDPALAAAGKALLPGSMPELAVQSILGVPGAGMGKALARGAAAAGAGTAIGMAQGKDPLEAGITSGAQAALGEAAGGVARAGARGIGALLSKDLPKLQGVVEKITAMVPGFAGKTPEETVSRLVGGEAKTALRKNYTTARGALLQQHGDPIMQVPALDKLYGQTAKSMQKATGPVSELWTRIDSMSRNLRTMLGDPSRQAAALEKMDLLKQADRQITGALKNQGGWPAAAIAQLEGIDKQYAKGSALIRLFSAGRDRPTAAQAKKIISATGEPTWPELQAAFQHQKGRLATVLAPQEMQALEQALFRGEANPLARDIPGVGPKVRAHFGFIPTVTPPHAPIKVGSPERAAEAVSGVARQGGARAGAELLGE